jgi:hypothetical protein
MTATSNLALKKSLPVPNHLFPVIIPMHQHFPRQSSNHPKNQKNQKKKKIFKTSKTLNNAPKTLIRIPLLTQNSTATSNLALKTHQPVPNHLFPVIIPVHEHPLAVVTIPGGICGEQGREVQPVVPDVGHVVVAPAAGTDLGFDGFWGGFDGKNGISRCFLIGNGGFLIGNGCFYIENGCF